MKARVRELKDVNTALSKRRRVNKSRIRVEELLTIEDIGYILVERDIYILLEEEKRSRDSRITSSATGLRHYNNCGKTEYNSRTC